MLDGLTIRIDRLRWPVQTICDSGEIVPCSTDGIVRMNPELSVLHGPLVFSQGFLILPPCLQRLAEIVSRLGETRIQFKGSPKGADGVVNATFCVGEISEIVMHTLHRRLDLCRPFI
ncbi:uncharacterized protein METZ01_LOCUS305937, partial [marine metagenome]